MLICGLIYAVTTLNKTIQLFLDGIGRRDEYEFYLDKFQSDPSACFALLCPDLESIEAAVEILAFDLHFLLRLELVPAILLCGEQAAAMQQALSGEAIFDFHSLDQAFVGDFILKARNLERVPVLVAEEESLESALLKLLPATAQRVHFIRAAGGLKSEDGVLQPYVYTQKENFIPLETVSFDYLALGRDLLEQRPSVHLSVTSPMNLLKEIFTVKGAGTLFRRGSVIQHFNGSEEIDRPRLLSLLESSFSRDLINVDFLDNVSDIYLEKDYRGVVLLEKHPAGHYLSKFAVGREARGEGVAMELWREVCQNHEMLFWRSNVSNPFNAWYHKQADGHHAIGQWQIFWRGVAAHTISGIIDYCCIRREDFS